MITTARVRVCVGLATLAGMAGAVLAPAQAAKAPKVVLGPNLLPNASFETSAFEPAPVPQYATSQPLLPVGWIFEGATGLFDHGQHGAHSGKRAITISTPAATPKAFCQQKQCVPNPVDGPRGSAQEYYSDIPVWRTQSAIPVTGGKTYQLSTWVSWTLETPDYGAVTAPAGAKGAIVLLGDNDGPWISSLTYDDAYFGTYTVPAATKVKKKK